MSDANAGGEYQTLADAFGVGVDRLARMSEAGWKLFADRKYREAAAVFRGLTVLNPEDPELLRGLALSALRDNDLLVATESLEAAVALLATRAGTESLRGQLLAMLTGVLYRSGRRGEAVQTSDEAIRLSPADAPWVDALKSGAKRASELLAKVGGQKPQSETSTLKRILRARMAEVGRGQQTLARALGYGDRDLLRVYENGTALLDQGQPSRAMRIFEGLVALDGGIPLFHLALATAREVATEHLLAAESYDAAVDTARQVPGGVDLLADALLRRARHAYKRGRRRAVLKDVLEALELPTSALTDESRALALKLKVAATGQATGIHRPATDLDPDAEKPRPRRKKKRKKSSRSADGTRSPTSVQDDAKKPAKIERDRAS